MENTREALSIAIKEIVKMRMQAVEECKEVSKIGMNSHGAGFEKGRVEAFGEAIETIKEVMEEMEEF